MARMARIISRMRGAGWLHSMREPLGDVRLDLAAEAEDEATLARTPAGPSRCWRASSGCGRTRRRSTCRARASRCARRRAAAGRTGRGSSRPSRRRCSPPPRAPSRAAPALVRSVPMSSVDLHGPRPVARPCPGRASTTDRLRVAPGRRPGRARTRCDLGARARRPLGSRRRRAGWRRLAVASASYAPPSWRSIARCSSLPATSSSSRSPLGWSASQMARLTSMAPRPPRVSPSSSASVAAGYGHRADVVRDLRPDAERRDAGGGEVRARAPPRCRPARRRSSCRYGSAGATTSADGACIDRRGGRVCGVANG